MFPFSWTFSILETHSLFSCSDENTMIDFFLASSKTISMEYLKPYFSMVLQSRVVEPISGMKPSQSFFKKIRKIQKNERIEEETPLKITQLVSSALRHRTNSFLI